MGVDITLKFPDWAERVKGSIADINRFIASQVQTNIGMRFDNEGSYNGHQRWDPLILRSGQILSDRGSLRKSIAPKKSDGNPGPEGFVDFAADTITVGTKLKYAALMNYGTVGLPGGKLVPKNAKALKIPLPTGKSASPATISIMTSKTQKQLSEINKKITEIRNKASKSKKSDPVKVEARISKLKQKYAKIHANLIKARPTSRSKFMFLKSVRIPARRFDQWNETDQRELNEALGNFIVRMLKK
jgi:phage gpG-like protein